MKYYLDEDLSPKIATVTKKQGIDCLSAHETGMQQTSDFDQLIFSAQEERCLVTKNRNDFIQLTVRLIFNLIQYHPIFIMLKKFTQFFETDCKR